MKRDLENAVRVQENIMKSCVSRALAAIGDGNYLGATLALQEAMAHEVCMNELKYMLELARIESGCE